MITYVPVSIPLAPIRAILERWPEDANMLSVLASLPPEQQQVIINSLGDQAADVIRHQWEFTARLKQLPPSRLDITCGKYGVGKRWPWRTLLILAGRGFGKTRTINEWLLRRVRQNKAKRIALVARTAADIRDTLLEGDSGILKIAANCECPKFEPSKRRLTFPNGAVATTFSADEPDQLRGPQHDTALCDELASWPHLDEHSSASAWNNLELGLRLGSDPKVVIATTPRPTDFLRNLIKQPSCAIIKGSSYENKANLSPSFFTDILSKYEGTTLALQEIYGDVLDQAPGALWNRKLIDQFRLPAITKASFNKIVIGVDPSASSDSAADETGIIVAGRRTTARPLAYVIEDLSIRASPEVWARRIVSAYHQYSANCVIAEANNGGEMVRTVIHQVDPNVPVRLIYAKKAKRVRAEPVLQLYQQGKVCHVGTLSGLEDQLCNWNPEEGESPDRLDACVYAIADLMISGAFQGEIAIDTGFAAGKSQWEIG